METVLCNTISIVSAIRVINMEVKRIKPFKKIGPLFISDRFRNMKDPCVVYDENTWHIFGTGGAIKKDEWQVLHATAPDIEGPWTEQGPVVLTCIEGPHLAAPSVVYEHSDGLYHMAVQRDYTTIGGTIEHLTSKDGKNFKRTSTILHPIPATGEAGLYDPHFSEIKGEKYLVYAGMPELMTYERPFTPQPDIYLAKSESGKWEGPWKRIKKILDHADIESHHNKREHPDYEWGIEGPQLVELPDGRILLNATCFIEEGRAGTRQRVFFAVSTNPEGPYLSFGPVLSDRDGEWESGENGHATAYVKDSTLYLFYQARSQKESHPPDNRWMYGIALFDVESLK